MKHCYRGEIVYDVTDPRHVGMVTSVGRNNDGLWATIQWLDTGWKSFRVPVADLALVHPDEPIIHSVSQLMRRLRENRK